MLSSSTRPRRRSRRTVAALGATVLLSTAACSGGSGSEDEGGAGGGTTTLSIAVQAPPRSLDPAQLEDGQQGLVWSNGVYDTLLFLDNDQEIQPNAAEEYAYSDDLRTLTLTLREGMTFSNGKPVTAEAVRATLERTRTTPGPQSVKLSAVSSVKAPDERTVVLELERPDPALLAGLALGAGVIADPATFQDPKLGLDPVGSGAYTLDDSTVNGSTYVLKRRADYWNVEDFPFETVTVRAIQDPTAVVNALQAGELNAAAVQPNTTRQLEGAGFTISDPVPTAVGGLLLLDRKGVVAPALADVRVRRAINMAFDRKGFVQAVAQGAAEPTTQFVNPLGDLYVEDLEDDYPFDPKAARALLAEAGYPDGFSLTLPSTVVSQRLEPVITQALGDIGIKTTWQPEPPQNLASSMQSKKYAAAVWFQGFNVTEIEAGDRFGENAFFNPFRVEQPEIEALMQKAAAETDEDADRELYQQIGTLAVEQALFAPVLRSSVLYATKDGVEYLPEGAPNPSVRRWGVAD